MARTPATLGSGSTDARRARAYQKAMRDVATDHVDDFQAAYELHQRLEGLKPATHAELATILEAESKRLRQLGKVPVR